MDEYSDAIARAFKRGGLAMGDGGAVHSSDCAQFAAPGALCGVYSKRAGLSGGSLGVVADDTAGGSSV